MEKADLKTEQKILEAAKRVFIRKGLEGSRMQEIADEAGINKALLHYYYRSKDKLFEAVFIETFYKLFPAIVELMKSDISLFEKIELFTRNYIDIFIENPFVPGFVLHELSRNPQRIVSLISGIGIEPSVFITQVEEEIREGNIKPVDPYHLVVNMLSMCIFPFAARPILLNVLFQNDPKAYDGFIAQRKKEVPEFIIRSIKKQ